MYTALIGYLHYEAPVEEQNFATLVTLINSMEVRADDEEFKNPVDLMFDKLAEREPNHFAVRQYAKYRLAAGVAPTRNNLRRQENYGIVDTAARGGPVVRWVWRRPEREGGSAGGGEKGRQDRRPE